MFGERLTYLRTRSGMIQEEVAAAIGVARTTYAGYEQSGREPDYKTLLLLADYFKVSTDYILGRTDNPIQKEDLSSSEAEFVEGSLELFRKIIKSPPAK